MEGLGNEPKISFNHTLVEFPPVLPFSPGSEVQVEIANPTAYPVEVYSLEFDKQHIEEETVRHDFFLLVCMYQCITLLLSRFLNG